MNKSATSPSASVLWQQCLERLERQVPLDEWNAVRRCLAGPEPMRDFPPGLIGCFEPVGELLAERLPAAADNPNEIPNRPVVIE